MAKEYVPYAGPVVTRAEAKAAGLKRYFTGLSCPHGHLSERKVLDRKCIACSYVSYDVWAAANADKLRAGWRAYAEANREKRRAVCRAWHEANPEKRKAYKAANQDKIREYNRAYAKANPERMRAKSRASHAKHPETKKAWQAANRDKVNAAARRFRATEYGKAVNKAYAKANPELFRASGANRRARKKAAEGSHTAADIQRIGKAQKWKCHWCGDPTKARYHVDHIQPLSKGGSNWPSNLCVSCVPCNVRKHAADPIDFARSLGLLL